MRDKKGQGGIVAVVVAIILGVVMLGVIYTMVKDRTETFSTTQNNEAVVGGTPELLEETECNAVVSTTSIKNYTTGSSMTSLCNLTSSCYVQCGANQTINISYVYTKADYYTGSTTRTIGVIIPMLLAVGLLTMIAVGFGMSRK